MRVTEKAPESAQSAIAAKITAFLSRTRSPLFCELDLHPEFGVLGVLVLEFAPKADQLHPLGLAKRLIRRGCRLMSLTRFLHPFPQGHLVDTDVPGDLSDRTVPFDDEPNGFFLVLLGETTACRAHS